MAKETKAQRELRESEERGRVLVEQCNTYPQRLMAMLERACLANCELEVRHGMFELTDRDDREVEYFLSMTYDTDSQETLHKMDW
jgi:hypothetical protein